MNLLTQLEQHQAVCAEVLSLTQRDHHWLRSGDPAFPFENYQARSQILPRLTASLAELRAHREAWQRLTPQERVRQTKATSLMRECQETIMKVLALDRENQQALLQRGLLPPDQVPSAASQRPHFVADLYQRHRLA